MLISILNGKSILIILYLRNWKEYQIRTWTAGHTLHIMFAAHAYSTQSLGAASGGFVANHPSQTVLCFCSLCFQYYLIFISLLYLSVYESSWTPLKNIVCLVSLTHQPGFPFPECLLQFLPALRDSPCSWVLGTGQACCFGCRYLERAQLSTSLKLLISPLLTLQQDNCMYSYFISSFCQKDVFQKCA